MEKREGQVAEKEFWQQGNKGREGRPWTRRKELQPHPQASVEQGLMDPGAGP